MASIPVRNVLANQRSRRMIDGYVLRSSSGKTVLVIEDDEDYYIQKILQKLQTLREKDLKALFRSLEEYLNDNS